MASWKGFGEWLRQGLIAASFMVLILVAGELIRGKDVGWYWFLIAFIAADIALYGAERWLKRIIREALYEGPRNPKD